MMFGGQNNDSYFVDNAGDIVSESSNQGTDTVFSRIDYTLSNHVENLVLFDAADRGEGNSLNIELRVISPGETVWMGTVGTIPYLAVLKMTFLMGGH